MKPPSVAMKRGSCLGYRNFEEYENKKKSSGGDNKTVPFTETSTVAAPTGNKKKRIKITPEIEKELDRAAKMGIDRDEYYRRKYGKV